MNDVVSRGARPLIAAFLLATSSSALAQATATTTTPDAPRDVAQTSSQGDSAAQTEPPAATGGLADIVVTATRRSTNVQNVPFAITAVGGAELQDRGITSPAQLSGLAPSLNVDQGAGNGQTHVSIRGLASTDFSLGASSPVATYIDDVYQPYAYGIGTQIFDLSRIEILRGPQGTLFGKNTTGGALLYYSQSPVFADEGYIGFDGGGGQFNHYSVDGAFNKLITDNLAGRFSFRVDKRDDYVHNLEDNSKLGHYTNYNLRAQLTWKPTDETKINLKLFGLSQTGDAVSYIGNYGVNPCTLGDPYTVYFKCDAAGNPAPASPSSTKTYSDVPIFENFDNYGATLRIDQNLSDFAITSIANAQEGHYSIGTNDDGTGADFFHSRQRSKTWQISEELRIATPVNKPIKAVLGLFGQYDHIAAIQGSGSTNVDPAYRYVIDGPGFQGTTTLAAFTNVTWDVSKLFSLIGGLRYSSEHKKITDPFFSTGLAGNRILTDDDIDYNNIIGSFDPTLGDTSIVYRDEHTWRRLTWDATINFKPSEGKLFYLKAASGFRSGGYVVGVTVPGAFQRLEPETVQSYEGGFKTEWLDRHLRVNGAGFWSDYKDQQVQVTNPDGPGLLVTNAGKSRIKGGELEVQTVPFEHLTISGSVGYTDAKYLDYETVLGATPINYRGNTLPFAPKWTGNLSATYEVLIGNRTLDLDTDWSIRSRNYFNPDNRIETSDPTRAIGNIRISYGDKGKGWRLSVYSNNITNQDARVFGYSVLTPDSQNILFVANVYAPRRTWGVQAGFKF